MFLCKIPVSANYGALCVQNMVALIANVEAAFKHENKIKAGILKAIDLLSLNELEDREEDESDENRLLPAMNKLWPYFIIRLKNKFSVVSMSLVILRLQSSQF
jgi:hypothetical protein